MPRYCLMMFIALAVAMGHLQRVPSQETPPTESASTAAAVPADPEIRPASDEAEEAIGSFRIPEDMQLELVAAEPLLANPVAFCVDDTGRIFVAESFRQEEGRGIEDNRGHMDWLDDDLAAQTVDDRLAYLQKHLGPRLREYGIHQDRVRLLTDTDGDGRMDDATVFADGFHHVLEGTGAGVLTHRGSLYYTCIPRLWQLTDTDGDGRADQRRVLLEGFGVRYAFRGHDLHGLCVGPDGKLYFSIGDRGFHVVTDEGTVANPETGAVFRCDPDGTNFEVIATGLRNPQELAFDKYGNLFTGDNNSDSGDRARWVYVVEGGDSGWRMAYQYLRDRGPWNREKLWHPYHEGQPTYIVPPVANVSDGPSGLAYYPGTGLPERYEGHFFLCDFRGGAGNSGIRSLAVEPDGATFRMVDEHEFLWSMLATDVTFGPDSRVYVSDWVEGWTGTGKGRIYRLKWPGAEDDPAADEAERLLADGLTGRPAAELRPLLAHPNMQVRQAAQFAMVDHGATALPVFVEVARSAGDQLARLHAIWGLGQVARQNSAALEPMMSLLGDSDAEVRAQAAKVLGEARHAPAFDRLVALLQDENLRVRFHAAMALSKVARPEAVAPLLAMLRENDNRDPVLRHAGVMGLAGSGDPKTLLDSLDQRTAAERMGVLLALRRQKSPEILRFLTDVDPSLVEEAARAIHDVPIPEAMPELAALVERPGLSSDPLLRRALNANFRLGDDDRAAAVAQFAVREAAPEEMRREAIRMLGDWAEPSNRDRVLGMWRPLSARPASQAKAAVESVLPKLVTAPRRLRQQALRVAADLDIDEVAPALYELLVDTSADAASRAQALDALAALRSERLREAIELALKSDQPELRAAGRRHLAEAQPDQAISLLNEAIATGALVEQQSALAVLGSLSSDAADAVLAGSLDRLLEGDIPAGARLDLLEAAAQRDHAALQDKLTRYEASRDSSDPLTAYENSLHGGDAERGRAIFFERADLSCVRCHTIGDEGSGGRVGPELTKIGQDKDRRYLLESIVLPSQTIAKGFQTANLALIDGRILSGIVQSEDKNQLQLMDPDGKLFTVAIEDILERGEGLSAMPADSIEKLSKRDLRDLVEFLATRK